MINICYKNNATYYINIPLNAVIPHPFGDRRDTGTHAEYIESAV